MDTKKTKIVELNKENPQTTLLNEGAQILNSGGIVAFPTETVYGLGANGLDKSAAEKIYEVKGRPSNNPLIFHIGSKEQLKEIVEDIPEKAEKLINKFWPGPLTLVFKKSQNIYEELTSGQDTIAVRMPENPIAKELIKKANVPVVAPSANVSGKPSPTKANHVIDDLSRKIDMIIDGGEVEIGLESTIVDVSSQELSILRPGKITKNQVEKIIGKLSQNTTINYHKPKAPGMMYKHYSPEAKIIIVDNDKDIEEYRKTYQDKKSKFLEYNSLEEMGKNLYADFRKADNEGIEILFVKSVEESNYGEAIMNRLKKAASSK